VAAEVALDTPSDLYERGELHLAQAGLVSPLRRDLRTHGAATGGVGDVLHVLRAHRPAYDLARDLADQVVVRRHLAAHDRDAEPPARVERHHARVAGDGVAGEHYAGDLGIHHQLDRHAHRLLRIPGAERRSVADRLRRVKAHPTVAHRVADLLDAT